MSWRPDLPEDPAPPLAWALVLFLTPLIVVAALLMLG